MNEIQQRWIMCRASNDHIILPEDSIDQPCLTHHGVVVMAPNLACNVTGAVGKKAREFNSVGRQVWTGQMLPVRAGKILRGIK